MSAQELVAAMMRYGASRAEAEARIRETFGTLGRELARGASADIPGIGAFLAKTTSTPARQAINPFTRETITFPARQRTTIRFVPDPALEESLGALPAPDDPPVPGRPSDPLHRAFVALLSGRRPQISVPGVGKFATRKMPARRQMVNPRTGAVSPAKPAYRTIRFSPAAKLKAASRPATEDEEES